MESVFQIAQDTVQYSTVDKANSKDSTVNSTVTYNEDEVIDCLTDLIPNHDYKPWYKKQLRLLGYERFMEIVQKARAGSDTSSNLFIWMLKNHGIVK